MKGLLLAIGPKKEDGKDDKVKAKKSKPSAFDAAADEAFEAGKDGDKAGFRAALKLAIQACDHDYDTEKD